MTSKKTGKSGEEMAEKYLCTSGYEIVATNFFSRFGEIDIIAMKDGKLIFVEVKTRKSTLFGEPAEAFTYKKRIKIIKTGLYFLNSSRQNLPSAWRIDFIGIKLDGRGKLKEIEHIKNI